MEEETKTAVKRAKPKDDDETTPAALLKELWKDKQDSLDKMHITQRRNEKNKRTPGNWHLVQVDVEKTNSRQAKSMGEYHVKYYVRNAIDSKSGWCEIAGAGL
jgi:hypothetical protein